MDELMIRMAQLGASGFCCSQILAIFALEAQGEENPGLVRAMAGLCNGMGDCSRTCGALSGGHCVLALYAAKGAEAEEADEKLPLMAAELNDWFNEAVAGENGCRCLDILGEGRCGRPDKERCGGIVAAVWGRCLELLAENNIDPFEPKGS